mgnify:CR=1 FL=1
MKKSTLTLMVLMAFAMSVFGTETNSKKNLFAGFDGIELTSQEACLITGGETYVFYDHIAFGQYHTGIARTDKPITDPDYKVLEIVEYGPENGISKSSSSSLGFGNNVPQDYEAQRSEKKKVKTNLEKYKPQLVDVPEGKTVAEFDEDVMKAAGDYKDKEPKRYKVRKNSCNTATSEIIKDAGGNVKPKKSVPGWKK